MADPGSPPDLSTPPLQLDAATAALVGELARKSPLAWISYGGHHHPVWHVWDGDAIAVVCDGQEQPLPAVEEQEHVEVRLRSKATRHLLVTITARVDAVAAGSAQWEALVPALIAGRLNVRDRATAAERWAASSRVLRLVPVGVIAAPGALPQDSHRARPVATPATTDDRQPYVVHRRQAAAPPLSG